MNEAHVNVYIHAPRERVFEAISDHAAFLRLSGPLGTITTRIAREGSPDRHGIGCRREVRGGFGTRFIEEITAWERPAFFEYLIVESSFPLRHHGGRVQFTTRGEGTEVDWVTRFETTVPFARRWMGAASEGFSSALFTACLMVAKARLEGEAKG